MIVIPKLDKNLAKFFTLLYHEQNKLEERPSCFNGLQESRAILKLHHMDILFMCHTQMHLGLIETWTNTQTL